MLSFQSALLCLTIEIGYSLMNGLTSKIASAPVIIIGSGNLENILTLEGKVRLGQKHLVSTHELIGGSCINYFLRMVTAGFEAFPIPQIGKDDLGFQIQARLIQLCRQMDLNDTIMDFILSPDFLIPGIQTAQATIIVHEGRRTIFSKMHSAGPDVVSKHTVERLGTLTTSAFKKTSLMIGHVPSDRTRQREDCITRQILSMVPSDWLVSINPGPSQYQLGVSYWEEELRQADIIQLNLFEIKTFFGNSGLPNALSQIIDHLAKMSITAIITLNKFGAIGIYKGNKKQVVIADPLPIQNLVDPTGAGDAFAAGVICTLNGKKSFSFDEFIAAIHTGRLWASHACTTLGASGECPNAAQISRFEKRFLEGQGSITIYDQANDCEVFNMLGKIDYAPDS